MSTVDEGGRGATRGRCTMRRRDDVRRLVAEPFWSQRDGGDALSHRRDRVPSR